jgi:hypothetical protein
LYSNNGAFLIVLSVRRVILFNKLNVYTAMKTSTFPRLFLVLISVLQMEQAKATINGPTQICPRGTYTYTISGLPWDVDFCKWFVSYQGPNGTPSIGPTVFHGNSFTINFNSPDVGTAWIKVEVYTHFQGPSWTYVEFYQLNRTLPVPVSPGVVIACGPNESITVSSSPYIPYNPENPSNTASCLFHCA